MGVLFFFFSFFLFITDFRMEPRRTRRAQRRDFLFLRALRVLRGSIFNFPKRGGGVVSGTPGAVDKIPVQFIGDALRNHEHVTGRRANL